MQFNVFFSIRPYKSQGNFVEREKEKEGKEKKEEEIQKKWESYDCRSPMKKIKIITDWEQDSFINWLADNVHVCERINMYEYKSTEKDHGRVIVHLL